MDVYMLNDITSSNILLFNDTNPLNIFYNLLDDNLIEDAVIVYNIFKWDSIRCFNILFLKWVTEHNINIHIDTHSMKKICRKGVKELFIYGASLYNSLNINDFLIDCILSDNIEFIQYIFQEFNILYCTNYIFREIIKSKLLNKLTIIIYLLKYIDIDVDIIVGILYGLCKDEIDSDIFIYMFSLFPNIIFLPNVKSYFVYSLINNNINIAHYLLKKRPYLIHTINHKNIIIMIRNNSYDSIFFIYKLNKKIFEGINHNHMYLYYVCNVESSLLEMVNCYLSLFQEHIDSNTYNKASNQIIYSGKLEIIKYLNLLKKIDFETEFITCCSTNILYNIKYVSKYVDEYILLRGFRTACIYGHIDIVEYLYDYIINIKNTGLYSVLYEIACKYDNILTIPDNRDNIIKVITFLYHKNDTIYPMEMIKCLCILGDIHILLNDETFYIDNSCICWLCQSGHFDIIYTLFTINLISDTYLDTAFIYACENGKGLFIANWLMYNYTISKNNVIYAFYNSDDLKTIKWLYSIGELYINIRKNNNAYFIECCLSNNLVIVKWLCYEIQEYSYTITSNQIIPIIDLHINYIESGDMTDDECSICYNKNKLCNTICNHPFCYDCINTWYKINKNCPVCRRSVIDVTIIQSQPLPNF